MKWFVLVLITLILIAGGLLVWYQMWLKSSDPSVQSIGDSVQTLNLEPQIGSVTRVVGMAEIWRNSIRNLVIVNQPVRQKDVVAPQIGATIELSLSSGPTIRATQGSNLELTTNKEYQLPVGIVTIGGGSYKLTAAGIPIEVGETSKIGINAEFSKMELYVETGQVTVTVAGQPVVVTQGQHLQATKDSSQTTNAIPSWFVN